MGFGVLVRIEIGVLLSFSITLLGVVAIGTGIALGIIALGTIALGIITLAIIIVLGVVAVDVDVAVLHMLRDVNH